MPSFGLAAVGLNWNADGHKPDRFLFNEGSERVAQFNLHWDFTAWRPYDYQLGRFWGVDALADWYSSVSPMQYGLNNPIVFNDPTGMEAQSVWQMIRDAWNNTEKGENQHFEAGQGEGERFCYLY